MKLSVKRKCVLLMLVLVLFFVLFSSRNIFASSRYYHPIISYDKRQGIKAFGQLINDQFYSGKESLFPFNRFYGYHAGIDLETFNNEKSLPVSVYAIASGTIAYVGDLSGYGGVFLLKLDDTSATALYGHVKIKNLTFRVGDHIDITRPVILTYLGDEFSDETSGERKHLHFAIYKGANLYFHGHEQTKKILTTQWYDPTLFLQDREAIDPVDSKQPMLVPTSKPSQNEYEPINYLKTIILYLRSLFLHK